MKCAQEGCRFSALSAGVAGSSGTFCSKHDPEVAAHHAANRARWDAERSAADERLAAAKRLADAAPALADALAGMLAIEDSVTQGQEAELRAKWIPAARKALVEAGVAQIGPGGRS